MKTKAILLSMLLFPLLLSCTSYVSREVPFEPPSMTAGMQVVAGAQIAARSFADQDEAKSAFGFNIRKAGLLPVQVVVDNMGVHPLAIVADQTFLIDEDGKYWVLLDGRTAYLRVESSSEYASIAKGAGKGSMLGAAGGAIVGAAIGILAGENVGEALGKGAAVGAAGGAVIGGSDAGSSGEAGRKISQDLAAKQLENRTMAAGTLSRGFLFFPGEAPSAGQLRLQLKETDSGRLHTSTFPLR